MPPSDSNNTRTVQIVFLAILLVAVAQVLWWIIDQTRSSAEVQQKTLALYELDVDAAQALIDRGAGRSEVDALFPHVEVIEGKAALAPDEVTALARERGSRMNQYRWEGAFFLAVLIAGMIVLWRALRTEAELRQRQQDFLAAVTHEFKSPLASLQLTAETMARRPADARQRELWVQRLLADIQRLSLLVTNTLEAAHLAKAEIELEPEPVDLTRTVDTIVQEFAARADTLNALVQQRIEPNTKIVADPSGVDTVVRNLLSNAIYAVAGQQGGNVDITATSIGDRVEFTVTDDGVGFSPEEADKLFHRFYRTGNELRRTTPGTGLGLAIVQQFVQLEGGTVEAASTGPGQGARFTVTWPRAQEVQ